MKPPFLPWDQYSACVYIYINILYIYIYIILYYIYRYFLFWTIWKPQIASGWWNLKVLTSFSAVSQHTESVTPLTVRRRESNFCFWRFGLARLVNESRFPMLVSQSHSSHEPSQEAEYVQNMFDCICSLMLLKTNQIAFGNLQGHLGCMGHWWEGWKEQQELLPWRAFCRWTSGSIDLCTTYAHTPHTYINVCIRCCIVVHYLIPWPWPWISLQRLELMIRMMKEKVFAATLALKLVDHSLRHCPENCASIYPDIELRCIASFETVSCTGPSWNDQTAKARSLSRNLAWRWAHNV